MTLLSGWHRAAGALLLVLTLLPAHRILQGRRVGVSGSYIVAAAERAYDVLLLGGLIMLTVAVLASKMIPADTVERWISRVAASLRRPSALAFAGMAGALCALLTGLFAVFVLDGKPNLVDAMVQLLHARFFAEGSLAGPTEITTSFWHLQNSVITDAGWVSHFPPGYPAIMAVGHLLGAPWLMSALLAGVAVLFTALAAERLLPERAAAVRLGTLLAAQSPFIVGLAGAQMNHVGAAAFIGLAVYAAVRGLDGASAGWAMLSGGALGAAFTIRPFAALTAAIVVIAITLHDRQRGAKHLFARAGAGLLGALPFGLAIAWYNARFFGSPLRFGYEYAYGPRVGLGFHVDPWGNYFGPVESVGFTASELITLGLNLLESPLSAVVIVGVWLLTTRRLAFGERIIALWALLPVAANFFYWHHGIFMGPRMLNEAATAWCVLVALSATGMVRALPRDLDFRGYRPRTAAALAVAATFAAGTLYLGPERLLAYSTYIPSSRIAPPVAPDSSLVFVHGAWTSRIVMRLAAAGMRLDSVETAMRQNPTCEVDAYSRLFAASGNATTAGLPPLDFDIESGREIPYQTVREEYTIRVTGRPVTPQCARELDADRLGTLDVSPMLWQVRVPGLSSGGAMIVRDMSPEENQVLIEAFPSLVPMMYYRRAPGLPPTLVPYEHGVRDLWR